MEDKQVNTLLTCRHVEAPAELRAYVESKAAKLAKFYDRIHKVEVILDHESEEQFKAEMIVHVDNRHTFVASDMGPDTYMLVDRVVERIERQLTKHKGKTRNHKHDGKSDVIDTSEDT